jgi:Zn ribbon nucleic-acid-binding protein
MDFMFEDEVDEVGSDVEAFCPKCKADTTHVVISKYEDEIRRVQCNPCGDVHSFRKPRGEAEDDVPEPVAARKRAMMKKFTWEEFFAKHGEKDAKSYEFRECYRENQIVFHPKFGKGFISEIVSESKVEVTFADARRILVHNRKDIPGSPLAAEDDGLPSGSLPNKPAAAAKAKEKKPAVTSRPAPPARQTPAEAPREVDPELKPASKKPAKKAAAEKSAAKKPAAKKPVSTKPASKKPAKKAAAEKPVSTKPTSKKPAKKAAAKKPASKKGAKKPAPKKSK